MAGAGIKTLRRLGERLALVLKWLGDSWGGWRWRWRWDSWGRLALALKRLGMDLVLGVFRRMG